MLRRQNAKNEPERRETTMAISVNTNYGAMIALQNLNATSKQLEVTQNRINTGLKVAGPKDNGAIFAIAQGMRSDVQNFNAVTNSLNRAISVVDTGVAAGTAVSDLLKEMKEKALAAKDTAIDANARAAYNAEFVALRDQITKTLSNATFDGSTLVTGSTNITALANADGTSAITATARNMSLGGSIVSVAAAGNVSTQTAASTMVATIETSLNALNLALAQLGTDSKKLGVHKEFVSKLADELSNGIGNLVDADVAVESARLQSLQTKQQLGVSALSIANQAPTVLLSLFR
jgi:flagellin